MARPALCIPVDKIHTPMSEWGSYTKIIDRSICDADDYDESHLQIIPYVVFKDKMSGEYFTYVRGQAGGEDRLKAMSSLGIGGHVDLAAPGGDVIELLVAETERELNEEVGYVFSKEEKLDLLGKLSHGEFILMYDEKSPNKVDRVHLGLIIEFEGSKEKFTSLEKDQIVKPIWMNRSSLISNLSKFERWSQHYILTVHAGSGKMGLDYFSMSL